VKEEWQELDELKPEPEPSSPADVAKRRDKLLEMVYQIVPYLMEHNAEAEACDVLMEIERLDLLQQYVDRMAFPRVCLYLRRSVVTCWQKTKLFCFIVQFWHVALNVKQTVTFLASSLTYIYH